MFDSAETGRYDDGVTRQTSLATDRRSCPRCDRAIGWRGNPHRPFCSLSCRLIDLGVWLDERYRIAGPELPAESMAGDGHSPGGG
jgi:endogenous inhibitor of DNA gyrase (YacG/DUF329 family)